MDGVLRSPGDIGAVPPSPVALMYHAVVRVGEAAVDGVYTLGATAFEHQLDRIAGTHGMGASVRDWLAGASPARVLLTFDDGRSSDHDVATEALLRRGMRADFFINPANVGKPGYASWVALREMSSAGMSIQSHGYEHRYFTGIPAVRLREELKRSKSVIEDRIGAPVTLLAPPGGRMPHGLAGLARTCGYERVVSSRPGRIADPSALVLPRMAVTTRITPNEFDQWIRGQGSSIWRRRVVYSGLAAAKRILGDARYEKVRSRALTDAGET